MAMRMQMRVAVDGFGRSRGGRGGRRRGVAVVPTVHFAVAAGLTSRDFPLVVALEALEGTGAVAVSVAVAREFVQTSACESYYQYSRTRVLFTSNMYKQR